MKPFTNNMNFTIKVLLRHKVCIILAALAYTIGISYDLRDYDRNFKRPELYQVKTQVIYPIDIQHQNLLKETRRAIRGKAENHIFPKSINSVLEKNANKELEFNLTLKAQANIDILKSTATFEDTKLTEAIHNLASQKITKMFPDGKFVIHRVATYKSLGAKPLKSIYSEFIYAPLFLTGLIFSSTVTLLITSLIMMLKHDQANIR